MVPKIDSIMEKKTKTSSVLRGNCCETCRNISQKTFIKKFTKKNSLANKTNAFLERRQQLVINKRNIWWSCSRPLVCFV